MAMVLRRIEKRNKFASGYLQNAVYRNEGPQEDCVAAGVIVIAGAISNSQVEAIDTGLYSRSSKFQLAFESLALISLG
jgi:hypothetical protein